MKYKGTSRDEITKKLLIARTWGVAARDSDNPMAVRYTLAYDAGRIWCEIVLRAEGRMVKGAIGHHAQTIDAVEEILGPEISPIVKRLQRARKARNQVMYDGEIGFVTGTKTELLIQTLDELESRVMSWLREKHPDLLPLV